MNHQVLSGDLMSEAPSDARFCNDDARDTGHEQFMDYRHVPRMDDKDNIVLDRDIFKVTGLDSLRRETLTTGTT